MLINIYAIYSANSELPNRITVNTPFPNSPNEIKNGESVCQLQLELASNYPQSTINLNFDPEKEWHPKEAVFTIYEKMLDGSKILLGSPTGYSYQHAEFIVKNLQIAYPLKEYHILRKETEIPQ